MKKTIISLLLALCMVVCLTAFTASAEETATVEHTHCACGGHANGMTDHACSTLTYTAWESGTTLPSSGNYYLTADVTLSSTVTIAADDTVNLCLHGHSINSTARVFSVKGSLNVTDCKPEDEWGTITATFNATYGGVAYIYNSTSVLNIYGGNWVTEGTFVWGSVILQQTGTMNLYKGNLIGGTGIRKYVSNSKDYRDGRGAGVYVMGGTFNMHGGTISGGQVQNSGGNVFVSGGKFNMSGGTITGGSVDASLGTLTDGQAPKGGNVYLLKGTTTITGGTITGGTAPVGEDIFVGADATLTVSGDVTIGDVYVDDGASFTIDEMKDTVGISDSHTVHCVCGGHGEGKPEHTCETAEEWIPWGYIKAERSGLPTTVGNYYLVSNVSYTSAKETPVGTLSLCLNGYTISHSSRARISAKGNLNLTDCGTGGQIKSTSIGKYNGIIYIYNDYVVNIFAGIYDASGTGVADGGIAHIGNDGKAYLNIYGGTFYGGNLTLDNCTNMTATKGGALSITVNSVVNMYGGQIIGGSATAATTGTPMGGCVAIYSGSFNMYGGSVTGGQAHSVYLRNYSACYLTVGGDVVIDNLYVGGSKTFTTQEDFTGSIGLTVSTKGHVVTTAKDAEQAQHFTSVEAGYSAKYNNVFGVLVDDHVAHCVCGGHGVGMGEHSCTTAVWMPWGYKDTEKTTLPSTSGNYYLVSEITVSKSTSMAATVDINLCLNGNDIKSSGTERIWAVRKTFGLTDCGTTADWGSVSSQYSGNYGGLFFIYENSEVNLYAGQLDASNAKPAQGGIALIGNSAAATMNIYNAKLIGATLDTTLDKESRGGVLYLIAGSTLNIYGGEITGGTAALGGGIMLLDKCTLNMYGGTVTGGTANFGGNIYAATGANVVLKNVTLTNGLAHSDTGEAKGGNIYTAADIEITNCTITGGRATSGVTDAEGTFTPGDTTSGGNIYAVNKLTVTGGTISDGAACHGGNIRANGETTLTNCTISGGLANLKTDGTENGNGGNIYSVSGATTTLTGCTITGGQAERGGSVAAWGQVTIIDTQITGGHAGAAGGNLMTYNNGFVSLQGSTVISGGTTDGDGGNIRLASAAGKVNTIEDGVQVGEGTAKDRGGCICLTGGTLKLIGNPVIAGLYAANDEAAYGLNVSELNCTQPIALEVAEMGVFADSTVDTSAMFQLDSSIEEVRYDSTAQKLFTAWIERDHIYVDATNGDDGNLGTQDAPVKTISRAMIAVKNGGIIHLVETVELATWDQHEKGFTITGGELVLPETRVNVNDHVTFDNLTITMPMCTTTTSSNLGHYFFYCDGFTTVFEEDVTIRYLYNGTYMTDPYHEVTYTKSDGTTVTNKAKSFLYGGCNSSYENTYGAIDGTDLTVLSGIWGNIFGGNNGVDLDGDVHLTVGGVVNEGVDYISHTRSGECIILGGSRAADINGTVYMNVTGGNYHTSTHGGSSGDCYVENIELRVTGGNGMALYGAGRHGSLTTGTVNVYYEGGTFEQVFGGTLMGNLTGDINLYVTGGNITRRLYGGCYTECQESSLKWEDDNGNAIDYFTTGNVNLIIGSGANISCDLKKPDSITKYNDRGIYGHSRREAPSSTDAENATIIFLDKAAYDENAGNLTAQDLAMSIIMNGVSAADLICYLGWSADDTADVIYANATAVADPETGVTGDASAISATASMTLAEGPFYYTGSAHEPATATVSDNWLYGEVTPVYANNTEIGTATASITANGYTVSNTFEIVKKDDVAQVVVGDTVTAYGWLQDAVNAVSDGGYLKMLSGCDEDVTVSKDLYLDLNGFSLTGTVTVEDGCTLYGMDSSTNDYDCSDGYGEIKSVVGTVALHHKTDVTGRILRYLTYTDAETGAVSFHRIYLGITHMSLRPSVVGVGYKAAFRADEKAQSMLNETEAFGYKLWITNDEGVIGSTAALYKGIREFKNDGYVTLRLEGFPVEQYGETQVWAEVYLKLNDEAGTVIDSSDYVMTLREMLEAINENVDAYSATQMAAIQAMCEPYVEFMQTNNWSVANILAWTAPTA